MYIFVSRSLSSGNGDHPAGESRHPSTNEEVEQAKVTPLKWFPVL